MFYLFVFVLSVRAGLNNGAFENCRNLTAVTFSEGVVKIGLTSVFASCNALESVSIPKSMTQIPQDAFDSCRALREIVVDGGNPVYSSQDGILYDKEQTRILSVPFDIRGTVTIPDTVLVIEEKAFRDHTGIEAFGVGDNPAFSVREGILYDKAQTKVVSVPWLIEGSVIIPSTVQQIGDDSFASRTRLTDVTIESGAIGYRAFRDCTSLVSLTLGPNVTEIRAEAFSGCTSLTGQLVIPDAVTSIGENAFDGCGFESVTIGRGLVSIASGAFIDCPTITTVVWNAENCTEISGNYSLFLWCSVTDLTIGDSVRTIPAEAFSGCTLLTSVVIPKSVATIGRDAFRNCYSLTEVTIENNAVSIDAYAFSTAVTVIHFEGTTEEWKTIIARNEIGGGYYLVYCKNGTLTWDGTPVSE